VDVSDQFQEIWVFFTYDGFIPVLEEVAATFMALIKSDSITGHETAHNFAEWDWACS